MMSTSLTAFGSLYKLVKDINNLIGYTNGITGTTKLVKDASLTSSTLTLNFGDGTSQNIDFSGLVGGTPGENGLGIATLEAIIEGDFAKSLKETLTDGELITFEIPKIIGPMGPAGGTMDSTIRCGSLTVFTLERVLQDAYHDFIGILPPITSNADLYLVKTEQSGRYSRPDGKTLRFFNNTAVTSNVVYNIYSYVELNGSFSDQIVLTIRPQEGYTMIWNNSEWTIVPGIINAKSLPINYQYEPLPLNYSNGP